MRLTIDVSIDCTVIPGDAALLMLEVAQTSEQRLRSSALTVTGGTVTRTSQPGIAWAMGPGADLSVRYSAQVDVNRAPPDLGSLTSDAWPRLPADVLPYLRPSRYCPCDLLGEAAQDLFGASQGGAKVLAIRDWVAAHLSYVPGSSSTATTALDTFSSRQGVCRDYAHLVCALARAACLPARYVSVYGPEVVPQDIHAVAQVWLEGAWHMVDATGMGTVEDMAVIAVGRDAADVAWMETSGWADLHRLDVSVQAG